MRRTILSILISLCVFTISHAQRLTPGNLLIRQDNSTIVINKKTQHIILKPERFTIEFLNKEYQGDKKLFYAAKAIVVIDTEFSNNYERMSFEEIPFFRPGTGFAAQSNEVQHFPFISFEGHNYLMYSKENKRIKKIGEKRKWDIYQWPIDGVTIDGQRLLWKDLNSTTLAIYFVVDHNLNNVIDKKEHHLLQITFKQ